MTNAAMTSLPDELRSQLQAWLGESRWHAEPLSGDASARAYYRVEGDGTSYILAYYPESVRESLTRFVKAYEAIRPCTRVPEIFRSGACAVMQTDVGDQTLFDLLESDRTNALLFYESAIDLIIEFQKAPVEAQQLNPSFDQQKFREELEMSLRFYVRELRGVKDESVGRELSEIFDRLSARLVSHPYVLCHRDYHGQNLHVSEGSLYMIDYQDLRMGPDTYDVASLLRDRGVGRVLGREAEERLIERYREKLGADVSLRVRYDECLLQRTIKILGTFASQAVVRGRQHYLDFIPPALETLRECTARLPEFARLAEIFPMNEQK